MYRRITIFLDGTSKKLELYKGGELKEINDNSFVSTGTVVKMTHALYDYLIELFEVRKKFIADFEDFEEGIKRKFLSCYINSRLTLDSSGVTVSITFTREKN